MCDKVHRHITLAEAIAYLTDGWHVKPYRDAPHKRGYALAWREEDRPEDRPIEPEN